VSEGKEALLETAEKVMADWEGTEDVGSFVEGSIVN
jgi:hypothetical protein